MAVRRAWCDQESGMGQAQGEGGNEGSVDGGQLWRSGQAEAGQCRQPDECFYTAPASAVTVTSLRLLSKSKLIIHKLQKNVSAGHRSSGT